MTRWGGAGDGHAKSVMTSRGGGGAGTEETAVDLKRDHGLSLPGRVDGEGYLMMRRRGASWRRMGVGSRGSAGELGKHRGWIITNSLPRPLGPDQTRLFISGVFAIQFWLDPRPPVPPGRITIFMGLIRPLKPPSWSCIRGATTAPVHHVNPIYSTNLLGSLLPLFCYRRQNADA